MGKKIEVVKGTKDWNAAILPGTLYERISDVLDILSNGSGSDAKIAEGNDADGNKHTFIFIKNYQPHK